MQEPTVAAGARLGVRLSTVLVILFAVAGIALLLLGSMQPWARLEIPLAGGGTASFQRTGATWHGAIAVLAPLCFIAPALYRGGPFRLLMCSVVLIVGLGCAAIVLWAGADPGTRILNEVISPPVAHPMESVRILHGIFEFGAGCACIALAGLTGIVTSLRDQAA